MRGLKKLALPLILSLCAGCTTYSLEELRHVAPKGTPFQNALAKHYLDFATQKEKVYNWYGAMRFGDKGLMSAYGKETEPENLAEWDEPDEILPYMEKARAALVEVLTPENEEAQPQLAADGQYYFDCWTAEQSANWRGDDIAYCRDHLYEALKALRAPAVETPPHIVGPHRPVVKPPVMEDRKREMETIAAPVAEIPPAAIEEREPEEAEGSYVVFFEWNKSTLSASGEKVIKDALGSLEGEQEYDLLVNGYTDTKGSDIYNLKLSQARAEAVKRKLIEGGVKPEAIRTFAFGKSDPKFKTGDNVAEPANRRVEILIND